MKITLKNFRCYTDQTFEFEDDTITLINGPSGHGKTTILLAIQFALYGSTNHKYLVCHNRTGCEVKLEYKNFKIKRTKRPNILNIQVDGQFYEDKEAQIILNKYFGVTNSSVFFMDLSHLEKMEFLEKIVNVDCDVKDLKQRIKIEISNLNKELAILDGQIFNTKSMLDIIQKPIKVEKPNKNLFFRLDHTLKNFEKDGLILKKEQTIKQLEFERDKNIKFNGLFEQKHVLEDEIVSLGQINPEITTEIETITKFLVELKAKNNHFMKQKENFSVVNESLEELEKYQNINGELIRDLEEKITKVEINIEQAIGFMEIVTFNKQKSEFEVLLNQEKFEWQEKVTSLQKQINDLNNGCFEPKNIDELKQKRDKFEVAQTFNLKYNLIEIEAQIEALKLKFFKIYRCGHCDHKIVINMDTMERVDLDHSNLDKNEKFDSTIKPELKKLENFRDSINQNNEFMKTVDIENLKLQIDHNIRYTTLIGELKRMGSFKPSNSLVKMEKKIKKLSSTLPLDLVDFKIKDLDLLKDEKRDLTIQLNTISEKLKVKENLLKKIENKENYDEFEHSKIINEIERQTEALNLKRLEMEKFKNKKRLEGKLVSLKIKMEELNFNEENLPQLNIDLQNINLGLQYHHEFEEYKNFHIQLKKYKKVKDTLNNFKISKENMEQTYLKTLVFKQKVIEAEHESLEFMVNIINTHLEILLRDFFSESFGDPIQIYLELVSDKRPQVNTVINYKGNKVDYKSLSTGEYARVKLAFDLTFKEILGENIIMLDECTANLDQDLSTKIFNKIKGTFPSKTILVVAHQVVMGTFDHVLSL